nr:unnamed protein product [Callosobruchus analis]
MYNDSVDENLKDKKTFFAKIFSTKFNLDFGSPACDTCSYCLRTRSAIQSCDDGQEKQHLISYRLAVHKANAKERDPYAGATYAFDLQLVQPLPKLNSERLFTHAKSHSTACANVWDENKAGRGAEEISSALTNFLQKSEFISSIVTIRLFADGCAGQNKNQHVVHALAYGCSRKRQHPRRTSLPTDRVFGRIEKKLRKVEEVLDLAGYHKIYKEIAGVRVLGTDWDVKNYKGLTTILKEIEEAVDGHDLIFSMHCSLAV